MAWVLDFNSFIGILCVISQVISGVALINWLACVGKCPSLTFGIGPTDGISINIPFLSWMALLILTLISFAMAIFEIIILVKPEWPSYISNHFFRAVVYILKGASVLGISGDFGFAAGFIEIALAICCLGIFINNLIKGTESFTAANAYKSLEKSGPNKSNKTALAKKETVVKK